MAKQSVTALRREALKALFEAHDGKLTDLLIQEGTVEYPILNDLPRASLLKALRDLEAEGYSKKTQGSAHEKNVWRTMERIARDEQKERERQERRRERHKAWTPLVELFQQYLQPRNEICPGGHPEETALDLYHLLEGLKVPTLKIFQGRRDIRKGYLNGDRVLKNGMERLEAFRANPKAH